MALLSEAIHGLGTKPQLAAYKPPIDIGNWLRPLLIEFQNDLGYTGARLGDDLGGLVDGMYRVAANLHIKPPENSHEWYAFQVGVHYAHLCYPKHPLDIRIYTGIFTWIAVLIDDGISKNTDEWKLFMCCFHANRKQLNPLAQAWSDLLRLSYQYYSPIVANFIVTSALNFVNANVLEQTQVPKMTCTAGGQAWPYYLRDKNGIAEAYAWLSFPDVLCPEISSYMEAIPDINKYIVLTNDILSYRAGEKDNYMHSRARYEDKDLGSVFEAVVRESVDAFRRTQTVLQGKGPAAEAWLNHAMGFVTMHKVSARYRLAELGLSELLPRT
ncbi:terpenoid synthase [Xylaria telfairii]|nr:terpenoid synthase [Xylaria telfairii]